MTEDTKKQTNVVNQHTGEKWYYTDIVKDHFFSPRNILLKDPAEGEYDAEGMVGSPACLMASTLVVGNPSSVPIAIFKKGEKVLGHDSRYHSVERVFKVRYPKIDLIKIRNYLGEIIATPDHLIYAKQIPSTNTFLHHRYKARVPTTWVHAGELKQGDISLYPLPLEVRSCKRVSFSLAPRSKWDFRSKLIPKSIPVSKELLELFGYFIAEGHTKADHKEVGFTFSSKEMRLAKRVRDLVEKIFDLRARIKVRKVQHRIDVTVYNIYLAHNFRAMFGANAFAKYIPEEFLFLDPVSQKSLIKGIWLGDGYFASWRPQPRAGFATISPKLFQQMIFLLLRQKIIPSTFQESAKQRKGVNHRASYRLHVGDMNSLERLADILNISFKRDAKKRHEKRIWFEKNFICLPIKKMAKAKFNGGRLYNFEVSKSHTYATDAFLVHNCGDMMNMWLKVDKETERVKEMKWRTFGCASAIAATSMFSVMITENEGLTMEEALKIKPQDIMMRLGGLPNRKIHCSVLADKAFRKAANDWFRKNGFYDRIKIEGAKVVDERLNITDKDIEEAVLEGATTLDDVQKKLKVGIGDPGIIADVEQLIRFYKDKYYG